LIKKEVLVVAVIQTFTGISYVTFQSDTKYMNTLISALAATYGVSEDDITIVSVTEAVVRRSLRSFMHAHLADAAPGLAVDYTVSFTNVPDLSYEEAAVMMADSAIVESLAENLNKYAAINGATELSGVAPQVPVVTDVTPPDPADDGQDDGKVVDDGDDEIKAKDDDDNGGGEKMLTNGAVIGIVIGVLHLRFLW